MALLSSPHSISQANCADVPLLVADRYLLSAEGWPDQLRAKAFSMFQPKPTSSPPPNPGAEAFADAPLLVADRYLLIGF